MNDAILLLGVTGSRAYDLDHEGSDTDRTGIFAAPTREVLSLRRHRETLPVPSGDGVMHEAGKAVSLLLKCNPSLMELLWLEYYDQCSPYGTLLLDIRRSFLSQRWVRGSYLGFADGQVRKAENRLLIEGKMDYRGELLPDARVRKHWRHVARLCISGSHLWRTGEVKVRMDEADKVYISAVENGGLEVAKEIVRLFGMLTESYQSPLPVTVTGAEADEWLLAVREHYWKEAGNGRRPDAAGADPR